MPIFHSMIHFISSVAVQYMGSNYRYSFCFLDVHEPSASWDYELQRDSDSSAEVWDSVHYITFECKI
jgi:hypothetical protein